MKAEVLNSAPLWRCIDFISDLHLQPQEPETFQAWLKFLAQTRADAVFILGDLFEVWVGDDCLLPGSFPQMCAEALRETTLRIPVFIMHGNRDFLLGDTFLQTSGCLLLSDPTVLALGPTRWLLSHGDALCLDDTAYQDFRKIVRSPQWQHDFLSKPLAERIALAKGIRSQSEDRKRTAPTFADVDATAALELLAFESAQHMIHGHTHRPFDHPLSTGKRRIVLSDWDLAAHPPRSEVLRFESDASNHWTFGRIKPDKAG